MKYERVYGLVISTFLIFSISSVNVERSFASKSEEKKEYVYKGPDGYLYELVSIKGPASGTALADTNVDFNFKKISKDKKEIEFTDANRLEKLIYSSRVQLDMDSVGSAHNFITSDILQNLSGRLLFGSR